MFYKALNGVKVLEYGNLITCPFCAKILGDLGAEVIKFEEPEIGDTSRKQEPFLKDIPGTERSGLYQYVNMNKLVITLNLETTTGKKIFGELLKTADIFVENNPPKRMKELGVLDKIVPMKGLSNQFVGKFPAIDFLFIDGDHSTEGCDFDFTNYALYVKKNGYIAFHDYDLKRNELGPTWVIKNKMLNSDDYKFENLYDSLWVAKKLV